MIVQQLKLEEHKVYTVALNANLQELLDTLDRSGYNYIPVVANGVYYGMAGYADVHKAFFESGDEKEKFLTTTPVNAIATNRNASIHEEGNIEDIFKGIDRVPFLAVLDKESRFNGLILKSALTDLLRDALGMHKPGVRVTCSVPEMKGMLEKLGHVVKEHSNIFGLLVLDDDTTFGYRRLSFKISPDTDLDALEEDLKHIGIRVFHVTPFVDSMDAE